MLRRALQWSLSHPYPWRWRSGNRFVFCWHDVSDNTAAHHSPKYSTTPARFSEQLGVLSERFRFVPLDDLVSADLPSGRDHAAITFDDGFHSVLSTAWPQLQKARLPFTVFVNGQAALENRNWVTDLVLEARNNAFVEAMLASAGLAGTRTDDPIAAIMQRGTFTTAFDARPRCVYPNKVFMDRDDLLRLQQGGVQLGDHGWSHAVLSRCDDATLARELSGTRELINDVTGRLPEHFALPFGKRDHYDERVLTQLRAAGPVRIHSSNPDRVRAKDREERGLIPRIILTNEDAGQLNFLINRTLVRRIDL